MVRGSSFSCYPDDCSLLERFLICTKKKDFVYPTCKVGVIDFLTLRSHPFTCRLPSVM